MERMVNDRLVFILEKENLLAPAQCGFRRHRSAVDHLISLERQIQNYFVQRQQLVIVFFDLEKTYNSTWRFGTLRADGSSEDIWHFLFPAFSKNVLPASAWETSYPCLMSKRIEFLKVLF
jgi:hypothetical protein